MVTQDQQKKLRQLVEVFLEENTKMNLSAIREPEAIWIGNVLDSLPLLDVSESLSVADNPGTLLDVGTGGGFPLLPLAICLPEWNFTGLDSVQKKLGAIQAMVDALELTNCTLLPGRTEELAHEPEHRDSYDIVTARALAPLNVLLEYCSPFTKVGGHIVAWKSMKVSDELQDSLLARAELGCHLIEQFEYELPEDWGKRQLLIFEKTSETNPKYPRDVGTPKKNPLL